MRYVSRIATKERPLQKLATEAALHSLAAAYKALPGIYKQLVEVKGSGWTPYPTMYLDPKGLWRLQLNDTTSFAGVFTNENIAFQFYWDNDKKKYYVSSFNVKKTFSRASSFWAFLQDSGKIARFIKSGLRTLDAGTAAFFSGKLTPDSVVKRILKVSHVFTTVDEWHDTDIQINMMLRTSKKVPPKLLEQWVKGHWKEVQALSRRVKTPPVAPSYDQYDRYGYDGDWIQDYPRPGLGWLTALNIRPKDISRIRVEFPSPRRALVHVFVEDR